MLLALALMIMNEYALSTDVKHALLNTPRSLCDVCTSSPRGYCHRNLDENLLSDLPAGSFAGVGGSLVEL